MWKRLRGRRRAWLLVLPVVLVAAAATGGWLLLRDDPAAASSSTATVTRETIEQTVAAEGTLAARRTADESFAVSGTVTRVLVKAGDTVRKGAPLARVDAEALVASREAAVSSLEAAVEQYDEAVEDGASDVQVAAANAAVVAARASLADAREAVEDATLRATIAGTVTDVGYDVGDVVGESAPTTAETTTPAITIVSSGSYVVHATVAAADVEQVQRGLQVEITASGVTDTVYGTVASVGLVAETNDSGAAVFPVRIAVTGKQEDLYAGVSATASIVVEQVPDVLTVPSRALTTEDDTTYVTKLVDGDEVRTEVEVGEAYGMSTEVLSGLEEGDVVVLPGFTAPEGGGGGGGEGPQNFVFPGGGGEMPDFSEMGPPQ